MTLEEFLVKGYKLVEEDNPKFWWSLGADQGVHHLTHYFIIYIMIGL